MEAKDVGDTISLYVPQPGGGAQPHVVFQERRQAGAFATRDEAIRFALELAGRLHQQLKVPVRMRIEDDMGLWETRDALAERTER
jgi:Arc/MetJ-type ribon-helix-helix transcriptional regulator